MFLRICLFAFMAVHLTAQLTVQTEFFHQYDNVHSAAPTPEGNFLISGWRNDRQSFLAEVNTQGHVLWEKSSPSIAGIISLKNQNAFILYTSGAYSTVEFGPQGSGDHGFVSSRANGYYPGIYETDDFMIVPVQFSPSTWDIYFFSREDGSPFFKQRRIEEICSPKFFYHQLDKLVYELRCANGDWRLTVFDMVDQQMLRKDTLESAISHINDWTFQNDRIYLAGMKDGQATLVNVDLYGRNAGITAIDWNAIHGTDSISTWEVIETQNDLLLLGGKRRENKPNFVYDSEVLFAIIDQHGTLLNKKIVDIWGDTHLSESILSGQTWTLLGPANLTDHNGGYIPPSFITTISWKTTNSQIDHSLNNVRVFPNPTDGLFGLYGPREAYPLTIITEMGKVVKTISTPGIVDLTDRESGMYFLLSSDQSYPTQKIIKQ